MVFELGSGIPARAKRLCSMGPALRKCPDRFFFLCGGKIAQDDHIVLLIVLRHVMVEHFFPVHVGNYTKYQHY